jgi:hypothetical protein
MTKRTRFTALIDQGLTRSQAAQRVKVRSRSTAKRWHDSHLAAQAPTPAELEAHAARVRASAAQAAQLAEEEARRAQEGRCKTCGNPQPPHGVGCHCFRPPAQPTPEAQPPAVFPHSAVCPCYACRPPSAQETHRQRVAIAEEACVPDPYGRTLTDEHRALADQMWADWKEDQMAAVRRQVQAEQKERQRERDRRIEELSRPMLRTRGHRL